MGVRPERLKGSQWQGFSRCPAGHRLKRGDLCGGVRRTATQAPCQPGERGSKGGRRLLFAENERWLAERIHRRKPVDKPMPQAGTGQSKASGPLSSMSSPSRRPVFASQSHYRSRPAEPQLTLANILYNMDRLIPGAPRRNGMNPPEIAPNDPDHIDPETAACSAH